MARQRSNRWAASSSPRRTCNSRTRNRSTCSAATPSAARTRDNTAKDLRYERQNSDGPAKAQQIELRAVPARPGPGLTPTSRRVPRLDGYSIVGGNRLHALEGEGRGRLERGNLAQANELD